MIGSHSLWYYQARLSESKDQTTKLEKKFTALSTDVEIKKKEREASTRKEVADTIMKLTAERDEALAVNKVHCSTFFNAVICLAVHGRI